MNMAVMLVVGGDGGADGDCRLLELVGAVGFPVVAIKPCSDL